MIGDCNVSCGSRYLVVFYRTHCVVYPCQRLVTELQGLPLLLHVFFHPTGWKHPFRVSVFSLSLSWHVYNILIMSGQGRIQCCFCVCVLHKEIILPVKCIPIFLFWGNIQAVIDCGVLCFLMHSAVTILLCVSGWLEDQTTSWSTDTTPHCTLCFVSTPQRVN